VDSAATPAGVSDAGLGTPDGAEGPADLLVIAGAILSMDPAGTAAEACAVRDGTVLAVGSEQELAHLLGPETRVLRTDGVVLPGLTDAHFHPTWGALDLARGLDLTDVGPLGEVAARVAAEAARLPAGAWVLGWGLDPNVFEGTVAGRAFDADTGGHPVALRMRDAHSLVVNGAALRAARITGEETFDDRSSIAVDADGPTGHILELGAMALIDAVVPADTLEVQADRVFDVLTKMATVGLTGGHVLDFFDPALEVLRVLEETRELPLELRCSPMVAPDSPREEWERIAALQGTRGRRWRVEGVKFMIDGTVDGGTAWMEAPDAYGENTGSIWRSTDTYRAALEFFVDRGIPTATHAIGDGGVRFVLQCFRALGDRVSAAAHRIEHIETIPDDLVPMFAEVGIAASMQPIHGTHHTRADRSDNWSIRVGDERAAHGWRCRDIRETGAILALGSDWPVTPVDPRAMMADAQLRRPVAAPGIAPVQPEQGLTALMAYEGYTTHAARAAGLGATEGRIAAGYAGNLTILARDPLELSPEEQAKNPVLATVVRGVVVHLDPALVPGES
jgi:predicted amidohydrolase YtcJ